MLIGNRHMIDLLRKTIMKLRAYLDHQWNLAFPVKLKITLRSGSRALGDKVCIFAHFSSSNTVDTWARRYLQSLAGLGFNVIFSSASRELGNEDLLFLGKWTSRVLLRENLGYDFGSWKVGIESIENIENVSELLLCNDSVYGPITDLNAILARCRASTGPSLIGLTESLEIQRHLQSYFIYFNREAVALDFFSKFWKRVVPLRYKSSVISCYELGLSKNAEIAGANVHAIWSYSTVLSTGLPKLSTDSRTIIAARKFVVNPLHFFAHHLVAELSYPFAKKELIDRNPEAVPDSETLRKILDELDVNRG